MEILKAGNNSESAWLKLRLFGLHHKRQILGFNAYSGRNSEVRIIDAATGMIVGVAEEGRAPKTERVYREPKAISFKTPGKRGRPAIHGCVERLVFAGPERKRGPKASTEPTETLIFFGPARKRGPKPGSIRVSAAQSSDKPAQKRGRMSEADRIKAAKPGEIVNSKGGSWLILACGLPTWIAA